MEIMNKKMEKLLKSFMDNEDIDEANDGLRDGVKTLQDLRYILAVVSQEYAEEYNDVLDVLISV
jgi:hypothetical protein